VGVGLAGGATTASGARFSIGAGLRKKALSSRKKDPGSQIIF
jgi:hypothetical protein